jgi:hypothetical protein
MRNYTNTLLFESALDSITTSNNILYNTAYAFFNPKVKIVEDDCETLLGTSIPLNPKARGYIELETGSPLNTSRVNTLSTAGNTSVRVRSSYSCISAGGICRECLLGSRPRLSGFSVGDYVELPPELLVDYVEGTVVSGDTSCAIPYTSAQYDTVYVYNNGVLLSESSYYISGNSFVSYTAVLSDTTFAFKFFVKSNVAHYYWLAKTYSGSLLGIKDLVELPLPLKPSLLSTFVNETDIEALRRQLIGNPDVSQEDFVEYIPSIKDSLEKGIFVLILGSIFLNQ